MLNIKFGDLEEAYRKILSWKFTYISD